MNFFKEILENGSWRYSMYGTITTYISANFSELLSIAVGLATLLFTIICIADKINRWGKK